MQIHNNNEINTTVKLFKRFSSDNTQVLIEFFYKIISFTFAL